MGIIALNTNMVHNAIRKLLFSQNWTCVYYGKNRFESGFIYMNAGDAYLWASVDGL